MKRAAERWYVATGDEGWTYLDAHDLRRTQGGHLPWDCGVLLVVAMSRGDWEDWPTFRDSYLGEMSPAVAERERGKISFASGGRKEDSDPGPVFCLTVETAPPY
ncbi:hypothetical protein EKH57_16730 [Halorubrum sp. BOL3-1]|uniref:hypothetical protein n=1 Tax=Halorubrum sp. BOL3-1 TaxID=2497325 RepID=UPI001004EE30|nr:hypothetical protein [Halorubrum sp. BOL3-1]QAU14181.1 hypothetical protein EKH57_16730 [Halorubrum sp. BOL3-1]